MKTKNISIKKKTYKHTKQHKKTYKHKQVKLNGGVLCANPVEKYV